MSVGANGSVLLDVISVLERALTHIAGIFLSAVLNSDVFVEVTAGGENLVADITLEWGNSRILTE